ncbi:MAG: selenide, water dikinase SelD, partial [Desulfomonilia bacterium]
ACKIGPEVLDQALRSIPVMHDPNLIVGMEHPDDAGVYRLSDTSALILTLDFFTPIVDDPYDFGQVAVANALSDVYAMGGKPLLAMNIICFPEKGMDISVLSDILKGGFDKMQEAGVLLVGGHSVDDDEIKYGLSVTGIVHPDRVLKNTGALPGDRIILTKPLGTGIINTAVKADMADEIAEQEAIRIMKTLNRKPAELMGRFNVHACTDITGFGMLGHASEMIEHASIGMRILSSKVPVFDAALEYAGMGLIPAGAYRNEQFRTHMVDRDDTVSDDLMKIFFDPQTSGGLFLCLPPQEAEELIDIMHREGVPDAAIIGEITEGPAGRIVVTG